MRHPLLAVLFFFFISLLSSAQDIHFSQYNLSPVSLNPSNTGAFDGDWRVATNFRTQWRKLGYPYNTFGLSYDRAIYAKENKAGLGILYLHDISGEAKLNIDKLFISGAYHFLVNQNQFRIGTQIGIGRKSFDISSLTFPDQFNPSTGIFDKSLPNGEVGYVNTVTYADINLGLSWERNVGNFSYQAGLALFHLNRPNESFFSNNYKTPIRTVFHASAYAQLNEKVSLLPRVLYLRQSNASELTYGLNAGYGLDKNPLKAKSAYIGIQSRDGISRNTDSFIGIIGLKFDRLDIGFSYDLNTSTLKTATDKNGAFELAAIFWSGLTRLKPYSVPCDRF